MLICLCPSNACTVCRLALASSRCVAKECRRVCTVASGTPISLRAKTTNHCSDPTGIGPVPRLIRTANFSAVHGPRPALGKSSTGWRWKAQ